MIKPHEITIGSLLRTNKGEIIKVESISTKRQNRKVGYHDSVCHLKYVRLANCEGIPLTEEILMANEFEPDYDSLFDVYAYANQGVRIVKWGKGYSLVIGRTVIYINYVHQLQTALWQCGLDELADNFKMED